MGKLYLAGTNHQDHLYGPTKLNNLYDKIKPDMLLTELCQEDMDKIKNLFSGLEDIIRKVPSYKNGIEDFMQVFLPFEYKVNKEYSEKENIEHHLIDMPGSKSNQKLIKGLEKSFPGFRKTLEKYLRVFGPDNFKKDFESTLRKKVIRDPQNLKLIWEKNLYYEKTVGKELVLIILSTTGMIGKRDKHMEGRVRELYDPKKSIVCTIGMMHILDSLTKRTLYSRIKDLNPERTPLI